MEERPTAETGKQDRDARGRGEGTSGSSDSLLYLATVVLRHRRLIVVLGFVIPVVVLGVALLLPRSWTATASFTPQAGDETMPSRLLDLAGQFGFQIGSGDPAQSPEFYANLIRSREVLGPIAGEVFEVADTAGLFPQGQMRGSLADLIGLPEGRAEVRREETVEWLREEAVTVSTGRETGLVTISVTTPWPDLASQVARSILNRVNEFNLQTRQSQAAEEREFIQERVENARRDLRAAETAMEAFLRQNRAFQNSPELVFEHDRLQREVAMRQQVYSTLVQSLEQARIAEVRNTPVLTVVESPEQPARPDRRGLLEKLVLGAIAGVGLGFTLALVREHFRQVQRHDTETASELRDLWKQTVAHLPFRGGTSSG